RIAETGDHLRLAGGHHDDAGRRDGCQQDQRGHAGAHQRLGAVIIVVIVSATVVTGRSIVGVVVMIEHGRIRCLRPDQSALVKAASSSGGGPAGAVDGVTGAAAAPADALPWAAGRMSINGPLLALRR